MATCVGLWSLVDMRAGVLFVKQCRWFFSHSPRLQRGTLFILFYIYINIERTNKQQNKHAYFRVLCTLCARVVK